MGYDNDGATTSPSSLFSLSPRLVERKDRLTHPTIYDDALPEAKFYCLLSKQLRICGCRDFGFRDLACPQPKRLRRQLSALINFLKYREDMGHLEAQALEEVSSLFSVVGPGGGYRASDGWTTTMEGGVVGCTRHYTINVFPLSPHSPALLPRTNSTHTHAR